MPDLQVPVLGTLLRAWDEASASAVADPADEFAAWAAEAAALRLIDALGHGECGGWQYGTDKPLTCACGVTLAAEAVTV